MRYDRIINKLDIKPSFLDEHAEAIRNQILSVGKTLPPNNRSYRSSFGSTMQSDIFTINTCVRLTGMILMLGSNPDNVKRVSSDIEDDSVFANHDPATVINSSMLYHLVTWLESKPGCTRQEKESLKQVHRRFDRLNWMVDRDVVKALGIEAIEQQSPEEERNNYSGGGFPYIHHGNV
jgi:hypothetical protein